jgi:hypothetical protein
VSEQGESLELRLERIKRVGNLRLDYLKRVYQGEPFVECYLNHILEIHTHLVFEGIGVCGVYRILLGSDENSVLQEKEIIVFCEVAEDGKESRPAASVVRLQLLDCCDMRIADTFKGTPSGFLELLWSVGDRKLCSLLPGSAVENSKLPNHVIECGTEAIGSLSRDNSDPNANHGIGVTNLPGFDRLAGAYRSLRLKLDDSGLSLFSSDLIMENLKLGKVFAAPSDLSVGAFE